MSKVDWSRVEYIKGAHPLGFRLDPDDHDFEGPRTPPEISMAIIYKTDEGVHMRHGVRAFGVWNDESDEMETKMKDVLKKWLIEKVEGQ